MKEIREIVTVLRYQVDKSGLRQYQIAYRDTMVRIGAGMQGGLLQQAQAYGRQQVQQTQKGYAGIAELVGKIAATVWAGAKMADQWTAVQMRVGLATNGVQEQKTALAEIYQIAQRARQEYAGTAQVFELLHRGAKGMGLELGDSLKLTELIGKATAIGGGDSAAGQAAGERVGQALASGRLDGEGADAITKQTPRLAQAIAQAFGTSVDELRNLADAGKLTSGVLAQGLLQQAEQINGEFAQMPPTFGGAMAVLQNALGREIDSFNQLTGAAQIFAGAVELLARNLHGVLVTAGLIGASWGLVQAGNALDKATRSATLLQRVMGGLRGASVKALWPYLRMAALLTSVSLIGDDILVWMRGGTSITGSLIGGFEEWQGTIDTIRGGMVWLKDQLGGVGMELEPWISKLGTIAVLVVGMGPPLLRVVTFLYSLGQGVFAVVRGFGTVVRLGWLLVSTLAGVVGWPALLVAAVVAAVAAAAVAIYQNWDAIKASGLAAWQSITSGAGAAFEAMGAWIQGVGQSISTWITGKLEAAKAMFSDLMPEWVKSGASWVGKNVLGVGVADVQRAGGAAAAVTVQNNIAGVTVNAPSANPAAVAAATQRGINGALSSARTGSPAFGVPMVEVMP
jgi:tape measure domain-containing protein